MQRDELKKKLILTVLNVRVNIYNNLNYSKQIIMNPAFLQEQTRINGNQSTCGLSRLRETSYYTFKIKIIL